MDQQLISRLRFHDACRGLTDEEIAEIIDKADIVHAKTGETIHRAGEKVEAVYLITQGRLRMSVQSPTSELRTILFLTSGDQFGALAMQSEEAVPLNVDVDEPSVLLRLNREVASELAEKIPMFRKNVWRMVGISVTESVFKARVHKLAKLVSFVRVDEQSRTILAEVVTKLASIGEKIGILCDAPNPHFESAASVKSAVDSKGDFIGENEVREIVGQWAAMDRVFLVVNQLQPVEKLVRLFELSDQIYCMSTTANPDPMIAKLTGMIECAPAWQKKTHVVWVLNRDEQIAPWVPALANLVNRDFKVQIPQPGTKSRLHSQGIDRLVHHLRNVCIGIALSGGAAKGMAHLGVLKALEDAGVTIDKLAGTSAGVLTGVIYCAGFSPDFGIKQFTKDLQPGTFFKRIPRGDEFYLLNQYRSNSWDKMLRKYIHDWQLEQFPIPIQTVTTDLVSAKSVVRTTGDGVNALLESINLPGLSPPICRDGKLLVDGGILNNLPADVLVKDGCNFVIGVDVTANIEFRVGNNVSRTPTEKMKSPGIITTLTRCFSVQAHGLSSLGSDAADVIIAPDVSQFEVSAFTRAAEMAEIGYQTTTQSLPRIREILANLDPKLFAC